MVLAGPIWHHFMKKALALYPSEYFIKPELAEAKVPASSHSILHYIRDNPELDPQYKNWEFAIQSWLKNR